LNVALLDHAPNQALPDLIANLLNDSLDESREPDTTPRKNAIDHEGSTQPEPAYSSCIVHHAALVESSDDIRTAQPGTAHDLAARKPETSLHHSEIADGPARGNVKSIAHPGTRRTGTRRRRGDGTTPAGRKAEIARPEPRRLNDVVKESRAILRLTRRAKISVLDSAPFVV